MASVQSNIQEVDEWLREEVAECLDFTRDGLGEKIADAIADSISRRTLDAGKLPDGGTIPANRGTYGERKRAAGIAVGIGLRNGGEMLDMEQLKGEPDIAPTEITMTYGVDPGARRKAQWFTGGSEGADGCEPSGAKNQPARPFYELDDRSEDEIMDVIHRHLAERS